MAWAIWFKKAKLLQGLLTESSSATRMFLIEDIERKVEVHESLSRADAGRLFLEASDEDLSRLASMTKQRFHPRDRASYVIMAIINYTNVCVAKCDYCSFYRLPHQTGGYLLNFEQICAKIDAMIGYGGTLAGFNGGFHPKLRIQDYAKLFAQIRGRYKDRIEFYGMTVAEFMFSSKLSKTSYREAAEILAANGSRWVTGGGAEILDDGFRKRHSPGKYTVRDYYSAQAAILEAGMGSTATMVIGFDETLEERLNHLESLRDFQNRMGGGLASFLCWTYKPYHNALGGDEISTREYLRWLAVAIIYLDNFSHIRTSVLTKNEEALLGLNFGADDFDLPTEDEVTQKAGATISHDFEGILNVVRGLGMQPEHRAPWPVRQTLCG